MYLNTLEQRLGELVYLGGFFACAGTAAGLLMFSVPAHGWTLDLIGAVSLFSAGAVLSASLYKWKQGQRSKTEE